MNIYINKDEKTPCGDAIRKALCLCDFLPQNPHPNLFVIKTSDKPKLTDILQNPWLIFFKSVKVMKKKEHLRNSHRFEKNKDT